MSERRGWSRLDWLRYAFERGYDLGFHADACPALLQLEQQGVVERNPTNDNHWRITEVGQSRHRLLDN